MNPRLIAIAGSLEGTTFSLAGEEVSIGRDRSNRVWINDVSVSRRHCVIRFANATYHLNDPGSYNGTRVNGVPVRDRALDHGDMIAIGDSLFLFLLEDEDSEPPKDAVEISEEMPDARTTVQLRVEDALYLHHEKVLQALPTTARLARDLNALLKVSAAINSIRRLDELQSALIESIFEIIPARRGALLLAREGSDEIVSSFGYDRLTGNEQKISVSRTIAARVLREGVAILSRDIIEGGEFDASESLREGGVSSVLCVPLSVFGKNTGVIYLDTSDDEATFDENHLQLVTAIAAIAAVSIENARHVEWLESENRRLQTDFQIEHSMIGESAAMREVYQFVARAAPSDSTVLIVGESGTGKELAARAIHLNSPRAAKPFVAINCAALADALLESELFGHERGAFTGAIAQKKGRFELADGGTLFLDEVGELAPLLQAKLLRALQEREFERVGGTRPLRVDVRVIAATNRDLEEAIRAGKFRQDLYYRLDVVRLKMPPLREREGDIPLLASYFARKYAEKCKRMIRSISPEARACLAAYDWPGNVRELENAIERAVVLGVTEIIQAEDLPDSVIESAPAEGSPANGFHEAVKEAKRQLILKAIDQAGGNFTEAARVLGIHPNNLHRLIRNLDLKSAIRK